MYIDELHYQLETAHFEFVYNAFMYKKLVKKASLII